MRGDGQGCLLAALFAILMILSAGAIGSAISEPFITAKRDRFWQEECVKRGYAEHNATTGVWQWKGEKDD